MAASYNKAQGTTIAIGTTAATASSDTYTVIEGAKVLGGLWGVTFAELDGTVLTDTDKQTLKGLRDAGRMEIGGNIKEDPATGLAAGQLALENAAKDVDGDDIYNFKITMQNGRIYYLKARVFSFQRQVGQNTNLREFKSVLIQQSLFTEAAAA